MNGLDEIDLAEEIRDIILDGISKIDALDWVKHKYGLDDKELTKIAKDLRIV